MLVTENYSFYQKLNYKCKEGTAGAGFACGNEIPSIDTLSLDAEKFISSAKNESRDSFPIASTEWFAAGSPGLKEFLDQAKRPDELNKLLRIAKKVAMAPEEKWSFGAIDHFKQIKKDEFESKGISGKKPISSKDARIDMILTTRDSSGKRTARKFS